MRLRRRLKLARIGEEADAIGNGDFAVKKLIVLLEIEGRISDLIVAAPKVSDGFPVHIRLARSGIWHDQLSFSMCVPVRMAYTVASLSSSCAVASSGSAGRSSA